MPDCSVAALEQAYKALDWLQPLEPSDPRLFRDLIDPFISQLARELVLLKAQGRKMLVHGHVGCGKSTLLNCLEVYQDFGRHFLVAPVFIKDVVDPEDIEAVDIFFAAMTEGLQKAVDAGIPLEPDSLKEAVELYKELKGLVSVEATREEGRGGDAKVEAGISVPSILQWLRAGFQANYRVSFENRRKVREAFKPRMGQLIERINATLSAIEARLGDDRRLLFLVHDTDKPRIDRAIDLFEAQGYQLAQLQAMAVFVLDKAVACSGRFAAITTRLRAGRPFPAFKLTEAKGEVSETCRRYQELLTTLLAKRLPLECAESDAFKTVVELGGGHFRETLRIAREAVFKALVRESPRVARTDVDYAAIQRANEFSPTQQQWEILAAVLKDPYWCPPDAMEAYDSPESPVLQLLNGVALMEYTNAEEKWLRPHPVLIERIRRRQK
ncbi:MAG: hypothetical protein HY713_08710 [candidate division NC10 bacterium]|nr:hypothetical protein [candidate division NC10 bacterium]